MLHKAATLKGFGLNSLDGEIGKVKEFYFDDQHWTIRYLVADTGNWLLDRQVLISPHALTAVNMEKEHLAVSLTKTQIENSPSLDTDQPVSQQFEEEYYGYYGWPRYWGNPYMPGAYPHVIIAGNGREERELAPDKKEWNPHLRSTHDVSNHHVQATDGEIGHIEDFIIDDEAWAIRYLVIDTVNWWPGKKVLLSPRWVERVNWDEQKVFVNVPRKTIKLAPEYTEQSLPSRDYEASLHRHYRRPGYWDEETANG